MRNVKWFSAFFCIANIRCSMIVGNYRIWHVNKWTSLAGRSGPKIISFTAGELNACSIKSHKIDVLFSIYFHILVPETKSPYDITWHELSSPFTESNAENVSETTHAHEPFFDELSAQINVTTQLGSDVILHCRVNDLREKMVCDTSCFYYPLNTRIYVFFLLTLMLSSITCLSKKVLIFLRLYFSTRELLQ